MAQMANTAWDILKDPRSKEMYDAFLQEFPDAKAWKQSQATWDSPPSDAQFDKDESQDSSQEGSHLGDLDVLRAMGFVDVSPEEVDQLKSEIDRIGARAVWSYTGFWFKRTVPIVGTMHPITFIMCFMA